jgi:SNF2 family DNA or RNA helicase
LSKQKSSTKYQILDDKLFDHIDSLPEKEQSNWLFLTPHGKFKGRWYVDSIHPGYFLDFEDMIGRFRTVSPASLSDFLAYAKELNYNVAFVDDPVGILSAFDHLNDPPDFSLNSDLPNTINGMLPFQLQGFNYLRSSLLKGGIALWSTGVGKTALEAALIKQHIEIEGFDLAICVVKANNKTDTQRKLKQLGDIQSDIIDGSKKKREETYSILYDRLLKGESTVAITNYEKFREDQDLLQGMVADRRVVVFWDEMPTKLSNRNSILYDSVRTTFYEGSKQIKWENKLPSELRQYCLTATPIENSPVGLLNQVRLMDPDVFPTISGWEKKFVATRSFFNREPETFKNLEEMGLMLDFMTHQVDKEDPDIAKLFPEFIEHVRYIDWDESHRKVYDKLQSIAKDLAKSAKDDAEVKTFNAFQLIGILQMLCDAPSMVARSAENRQEFEDALADAETDEEVYAAENSMSGSEAAMMLVEHLKDPLTDDKHTKLLELKSLITEKHSNEKIIVFSKFANYIQPVLTKYFDEWGLTYTVFAGNDKKKLEAKDRFRNDPDIQIFLSSDSGSDGMDLPEASVTIHFDLPPTWARKKQRENRMHRVNSTHESVTSYVLLMANSVEDRWKEIIDTKEGYHRGVFKGEISENAISSRMTSDDLYYIITGEELTNS